MEEGYTGGMRLSLRFLIPLLLVLGVIGYAVVPLVNSLMRQWAINDLDLRAQVIGSAVDNSLFDVIDDNRTLTTKRVKTLFDRVMQDERLYALGFCSKPAVLPAYKTERFPADLLCPSAASGSMKIPSTVVELPKGPVHVGFYPIQGSGTLLGELVLIHDMSFVATRSASTARYIMYFFVLLSAVVAFITVIIAQLSWRGWVLGMRALLRGEGLVRPLIPTATTSELQPVAAELRDFLRTIDKRRNADDDAHVHWTPDTLRALLKEKFIGDEVIVVSHREPYVHAKGEHGIDVRAPANGMLTAVEPVMRACSGTWVAHGSGSADRETVDAHDRVAAPPDHPSFTLRRVWLSKEEEDGYYFGFSNEGLWPLCHIAHVQPTFRSSDWEQYKKVNQKFANVVLEEVKTDDPVILVQDYMLALVPRMIREKLPNATIIAFWHIPWPNPESLGICPWITDILDGLLGSNIVGFHTRQHNLNFVGTVERFLECRVDRASWTISYRGKLSAVNHYPISIEYPSHLLPQAKPIADARAAIRKEYGLPADHLLGIGVERLDYTKGVIEKFLAVERLLELHPEWIGRFTFLQVGFLSRLCIPEYRHFERDMRECFDRINARFGTPDYRPLILRTVQATALEVIDHYRAADLCFVNSLHDGMNLVAKEFIAARDDERGVLILSKFAGAAHELLEALIVNPYHTDQCAEALHEALTMPPDEQRDRMRNLQGFLYDFNIYRWAGRMLLDAARMRQRSRFVEQAADEED